MLHYCNAKIMDEDYKLAKWLNNELTDEELAEFKQNPDFTLYEKIKENSARLKTPEFDQDKMLSNVVATKKETKVVKLQQNWFTRVAAVLIIGLGLSFFIVNNVKEKYYGTSLTQTVSLPDNSEVLVNKNSSIEYKTFFWKNNRTIDLKGEAYFKVAKGKTFEVNTNLGKVTVLGTQFNVNSKDNTFEVTCYEGKVKVNYKNQELILTKGMLVTFENDSKTEGKTTLSMPNWASDEIEMSFTNQNLKTIITDIENTYNVTIKTNTIATDQLFTGKIPNNNLDVALQIIASTYHLQIKKSNETSFELVKK
ncbi:FecR family protein [Flavobacterium sp.]|uniref:FecR family protein n=1 Tax=Flavobacterium sp. TaxID=239 RepID=UPI0037BEFCF3